MNNIIFENNRKGIEENEEQSKARCDDCFRKCKLDSFDQISERQVLDAVVAEAIKVVFNEYVEEHGLGAIAEIFRSGVRVEVGDQLPSSEYAKRLKSVPPAWDMAFEVNASNNEAVRASCVEFVLAGLYATDRISRNQQHGR